ncbi:MAG: hypothetical protein LBD01_00615 [Puniceicoccales bacterium]|nr:hypothetical protein [Puniceicoccales bacterium]
MTKSCENSSEIARHGASVLPGGLVVAPFAGGAVSFEANACVGEDAGALLGRLLGEVRKRGLAPVQGNIFGDPKAACKSLSGLDFPLAVLGRHGTPFGNVQSARVLALPEGAFTRVRRAGTSVGAFWQTGGARYLLLGALVPADLSAPPDVQSAELWRALVPLLASQGFALTDIVRTWFYNDHILDWYADFNRVRTAFFNEHDIFGKLVPASTGVGACNTAGAALSLDVLAVVRESGVSAKEVVSPLQRSANEYRSAFSRAVELAEDRGRLLLVSGTASIEPSGLTVFQGDLDEQIKLSLRVVEAIVKSRGMAWGDVSRAVLYFPDIAWMARFEPCRQALGIPPFPAIYAHCDICRDDLLFELEVDLWAAQGVEKK